METWKVLLTDVVDKIKRTSMADEAEETRQKDIPTIISKELLLGPKAVLLPPAPNLRSVTADSIEGRSMLHQYFKLFHENYVEYAHKDHTLQPWTITILCSHKIVHFELHHHASQLKKIIDDEHSR